MQAGSDRFDVASDRGPLEAIVQEHAAAVIAAAVRALLDSGAIVLPADLTAADVQVTAEEPARLTLTLASHDPRTFQVAGQADDPIRLSLERELELAVAHLNEIRDDTEPSHPQW